MSSVEIAELNPETGEQQGAHRIVAHTVFRRNGIVWVAWQCSCGVDSPLIDGRQMARERFREHREACGG